MISRLRKNEVRFSIVIALLVLGLYATFIVKFDDTRYVFRGITELPREQALEVLSEKPSILMYDPDPARDEVVLMYDFKITCDGDPDSYPCCREHLEFTKDRDPGMWLAFGMTTALCFVLGGLPSMYVIDELLFPRGA